MNRKFLHVLTIVGHGFNLLSAFFYCIYVALLITFKKGNATINQILLWLSIAFILFLVIGLLVYVFSGKKITRSGKRVYAYLKLFVRLISAGFIIVSLANMQYKQSDAFFMLLGVFFAIFSFFATILLDVLGYLVRKHVKKTAANVKETIGGQLRLFAYDFPANDRPSKRLEQAEESSTESSD